MSGFGKFLPKRLPKMISQLRHFSDTRFTQNALAITLVQLRLSYCRKSGSLETLKPRRTAKHWREEDPLARRVSGCALRFLFYVRPAR
jgi:hypothetical protein